MFISSPSPFQIKFISLPTTQYFSPSTITTKGTSSQAVLYPICLSWWEMWKSLAEIINFIACVSKVVPGLFPALHISTWENECAEDIKLESKLCLLSPSKYNSWLRTDLYDSWSNIVLVWHLMFAAMTLNVFGSFDSKTFSFLLDFDIQSERITIHLGRDNDSLN